MRRRPEKPFYTVAELAKLMCLSPAVMRRRLRKVGLLPAEKAPRTKVLIPLARFRYVLGEDWESALLWRDMGE